VTCIRAAIVSLVVIVRKILVRERERQRESIVDQTLVLVLRRSSSTSTRELILRCALVLAYSPVQK